MKDKGYIGKISNSGTQDVKAPMPQTGKNKLPTKKGNDLRSKKTTGGSK